MRFLSTEKGMDMTTGRLFPNLLAFAIPLVLSGVLQLLFNAVALVVIGNFSQTRVISLAAVSSNNSLINLFVNVAIGVSLGLSGLAAGAATVGCCANMIGFAVISFRENKVGGLVSQGIGTSMLQMPNIVRNPRVWIPAILSSAILGPVSTLLLKMYGNPVGSGMGTSGLVGPIQSFMTMINEETMSGFGAAAEAPWLVIIKILVMYFILPAGISLGISEIMRKLKWIKPGDLSLNV